MKHDILIVGAGVAGLMTAIELRQAGMNPWLFDSGQAGMESSWAGGGILSPIYPWNYPDAVNDLAQWSINYYADFFPQLKEETGIDPQWLTSGHLVLQTDMNSPGIKPWAARYNINIQQIDRQQILEIEPALSTDFDQSLWLPDVGQVRNPRLLQTLIAYAKKLGITISENSHVSRVLYSKGQITGLKTDSGNISTDKILITAGAWSGQFQPGTFQPPIQPVKGQMIQLQSKPGSIKRITLNEDRYVIPRKDGKILIGSTLEHCGFNKSIDDLTQRKLQTIAASIYPSLESAPVINHWSGLRPGNERLTPYIGSHPEINGLFFNAGHYRNGIVLGPASARLCANIITDNETILEPSSYSLH